MLLCERNEEIFIYCVVVSERCASVSGCCDSVSERCDSVEGGDVPVTIGRHSTTEHAQRPIGFADGRLRSGRCCAVIGRFEPLAWKAAYRNDTCRRPSNVLQLLVE